MKKCSHCGCYFQPKRPKMIYCSTKCRTYAFRKNKEEHPTKEFQANQVVKPTLMLGDHVKKDKPQMPKGLTLDQQIQWKIDNL